MLDLPDPSEPLVLHRGWQDRWAPALTDPALRRAILDSDRFVDRIADDLCGTDGTLQGHDPDRDETLHRLNTFGQPNRMHHTGLMWLSPRLVLCLAAKDTRDVCGRLTHDQVRDVARYRDHLPVDRIGPLPDADAVRQDGWKCLAAWALGLASPLALSLQLRLPPQTREEIDEIEARAELMGRIMRDLDTRDI